MNIQNFDMVRFTLSPLDVDCYWQCDAKARQRQFTLFLMLVSPPAAPTAS
jgi:hypothetical protein